MRGLNRFKTKLLLFLTSGIFLLSFSFIIISCGTSPLLKVFETMKGPYAIDFSLSSNTDTYISVGNFPSISNSEITFEAQVKAKSSSVKAPIFSHADTYRGILVYLYDNVLKTKIGYGSTTSTSSTVSSGYTLPFDGGDSDWKHIAVVLTNKNHSGVHTACSGAESAAWHIDFYVDGAFQICGSTSGNYAYDPTEVTGDGYEYRNGATMGYISTLLPMQVPEGSGGALVSFSEQFNAIIDDVRFWLTARSASEITQCKDDLLGLTSPCNIDNAMLKGYWPLNEGTGTSVTDISGSEMGGTIYSPVNSPWSGGWTTGKF